MNPKETTEYIKLRGAAIMFLEAEKKFTEASCTHDAIDEYVMALTRLDAARSVLWDVINDKDLTKQS